MKKSDQSLYNICIASIKRKTIKPYDFKWAQFYDSDSNPKLLFQNFPIDFEKEELIICSVIIDSDNYSILTTRKLVTNNKGNIEFGNLINAKNKWYGEFKSKTDQYALGEVELVTGERLPYFIETDKASMIMIYGINTLIDITKEP
ncbi:hypothetical protein [Chryseobacterium lathyri]|jgi:hypothetical protein|uniref:Uncharacterized protein n=1 Tax=Chryseobacterium lathyri TaxID=395933 RepID=A0A511YBP4_9FLAO|nr:hypothetical protein [Chryseobacterium lathyri]GEN72623.1 hypothetical protein CLA01_26950 [Chryseobacterium lathyri]